MSYFLPMDQTGKTRGVVIFIIAVLSITILWQINSDQQQKALDEIEYVSYISGLGELELKIPKDWVISDDSIVEEEGYYSLEIDGPRNASIARQVNEKYLVDIDGETITTQRLIEILNEPISADYILALIDIISASSYQLEESIDSWKENLLAQVDTTSSTSFSQFEKIQIDGAPGYKYVMTIIEGEQMITSTNYFILGETAQVEATIYPNTSNNASIGEEIVNSINFLSAEDLVEQL